MTITSNNDKDDIDDFKPMVYSIPQRNNNNRPAAAKNNNNDININNSKAAADTENDLTILLHEVPDGNDSEQHDTGFVMWPSAVLLSRWITMHPSVVLDNNNNNNNNNTGGGLGGGGGGGGGADILELGAGCGLVGLTAATLLRNNHEKNVAEAAVAPHHLPHCGNVIFTDYNPTVLANLEKNIRLNRLDDYDTESGQYRYGDDEIEGMDQNNKRSYTSVVGLDFFDQQQQTEEDDASSSPPSSSTTTTTEQLKPLQNNKFWIDMNGVQQPQVGLILAADIMAYSNDAEMVAATIQAALIEGGQAIVLGPNEDRRFGVKYFEEACYTLGLTVTKTQHLTPNDLSADPTTKTATTSKKTAVLNSSLEEQASGYGEGYDFTMFTVDKPILSTPTIAVPAS